MYTLADFRLDFPQFAAVSDATVQRQLDNSAPFFDVARWDTFYPAGVGSYVAHMLTLQAFLAKSAGAAMTGNTAMKKVGDASVQYDAAMLDMSAKDPFMRTIYGQEYARLRRIIGSGGLAV